MQSFLQPLTPNDIPYLIAHMQAHYSPAYAYLWNDAGAWYVKTMYNLEKLTEEFKEPKARFYRVTDGTTDYGFCKTIPNKAPQGANEQLKYFYLQRLYLATNAQGKGIGSRVMQEITAMAHAQNYNRIWLEAMEIGRAKAFYEKLGYRITDLVQLPFPGMKDEFRGLVTMELTL